MKRSIPEKDWRYLGGEWLEIDNVGFSAILKT
jgi:hypothetical protein